ncbi:hypothetical protein KJ966_19975 [bacterium]|nr:hypothetical protein [bacterium]
MTHFTVFSRLFGTHVRAPHRFTLVVIPNKIKGFLKRVTIGAVDGASSGRIDEQHGY